MNGAVQVQLGLKKFFIYFVVSAALGLFFNTLIQKYVSETWSEWESKLKEKNIQGSPPQIVFSRYGWPVIGARIPTASSRVQVKCFVADIKVDDIFIPLPLYQLIVSEFRFGAVNVAKMEINIAEQEPCLDSGNGLPDVVPALGAEESHELIAKEYFPAWFTTLEKWFATQEDVVKRFPVPQMSISEIVIKGQTASGKELSAQGDADFSIGDEARLNINLSPIEFKKKDRALSTNFTAQVTGNGEHLRLLGDWSYYEGHLKLDFDYKKDGTAIVNLSTHELPVSVLNRWFDTDWAFQFLWFDCGLHIEATKSVWQSTPWKISACKMSGPHGEIKVSSEGIVSLKNPENVVFNIDAFDLDKVLKGKESMPLTGVFKSFGVVDGEAHIASGSFSSKLNFHNAQVVFSRQNRRKLQVIEEMKVDAGYKNSTYSVIIDSAKIQKGEFDGFVAIDYNKRQKRANGKVLVNKLAFSPEIQEIMWGGQFSPFAVTGGLSMDENFKIDNARMNLGFKTFEEKGLKASNGNVLLEWNDGVGKVAAGASQVKVSRDSEYTWFFATLLDAGLNKDVLAFSKIHASGRVEKGHVEFDNIVASAAGPRAEITADYQNGNSQGAWVWQGLPVTYEWKWFYRNREFMLIPQTTAMKEWLKLNDHFLDEYRFIHLENPEI